MPSCAVPGSASLGSTSPTPCLRSLELPPALAQSYFVADVFALRAQLDPSNDPDLAAALGAGRTVWLNGARSAPLEEGATTACLLSWELAPLSLQQPHKRQEAFARIDAQLAARISAATSPATAACRTPPPRPLPSRYLPDMCTVVIVPVAAPQASPP